jgi:hypothetical protein
MQFDRLKRREFITLLGGTAATWPLAASAQQTGSPRRLGVLLVGLSPESKEAKQFRLGLRDAGYFEGRDVVIEWRFANGDYDRVPELVADLVKSKVDVIVEDSTVGTQETRRATSAIPIVMALVLVGLKRPFATQPTWETRSWALISAAVTGCAGSWSTLPDLQTGWSTAPSGRQEIPTHRDAFAGSPC